ncbi:MULTISPECIES: glycerol-3-phosphate responsive antiterminator [Mammaliicoccus]|jgi:glycerol uptake operon antiterminator|uniref:Glycerol uptake operon antiterminator regulatory protein n=2 Tax=Staphylococcaceae TaxID=90964 RepID=A0AAW5LRB0_MAMSC|nr:MULTISPECIES: glycerol-3-phosphate responsive antiterminator [Mammaliicoccus]KTT81086.1 glycerol-3-phosphate responsive antiterminator GlpP [Mammaliicoccus sciuri]MBA1396336.1 glycerol-3-phosphate responsive antiterminator GlpP [Mammaliicoccus sciuri]MBF0718867.1 glycerol-3-phosphate responsive antiterminator [Mammaliicoccus sciuri]MBG9205323.1 glycerol-3-phosphate responsive antiterminator [Mammaliicoccus sciuri]MBG9209931.1 glycerol-3-phosphate responsive antiterminator [Mammaliicoccus sc
MNNHILPAIRSMKDMEKFFKMDYERCVLLDTHIGHLQGILEQMKKHQKEVMLHIDLIKGLSNDEAAVEYVIQQYKPHGIISTKSKIIKRAKKLNTLTILRVFILDSTALSRSIELIKQSDPDLVEVLPGVATKVIKEISDKTGKRIIAGGLINTKEEIDLAIESGAQYVTSSDIAIW